MTSIASPAYDEYPQYCYHLSPTINKWCPLRAVDITQLRWHPGFEGQDDTFFCLNHPVRWVRILGIVVAIDTFYGHRVYTVDDSTGVCIECPLAVLPPQGPDNGRPSRKNSGKAPRLELDQPVAADPYPEVDVGTVVEIKGSLKLFRDQKQVKIAKMQHIKSTNREVQFWEKIKAFRSDVLEKPWSLEPKILRRLERENKSDLKDTEPSRRKREHAPKQVNSKNHRRSRGTPGPAWQETSGKKAYKPSNLSSAATVTDGQYDALGL